MIRRTQNGMNKRGLTGSISSFNVPRYKRNPNATETNVNETMAKIACLSVMSITGVAGMFGLNLTSSLELVGSTPGSLFLLKEYSTSFVSCWSWLQDVTFSGSAVLVAMVTNEVWNRPLFCLVYVSNNLGDIRSTDSRETSLFSLSNCVTRLKQIAQQFWTTTTRTGLIREEGAAAASVQSLEPGFPWAAKCHIILYSALRFMLCVLSD